MLRGIQKASSTWVGKSVLTVIMGFLVISFAIWGIGDIFRGFGQNSVAKIGSTEITIEQFRNYYSERLQQLGRQMGRPITPDEARQQGLDRQLLGQLVAETTLNELARDMRLGLDNKEIAERITTDPNFKGLNGQFDHNRFAQIIQQAGYTEARFVEEQRRVMLRRQIAQSVSGDLPVPMTAINVLNQYQNEKRAIDYIALGAAQAGDIPAPTAEELSTYFDERKMLFRAPEYRKVTLVSLSPAALAKPDQVSDADARAFYDANKDSFGKPEQRDVHQIVFPNPEEAAAAREKLTGGMSFADLAKERGLSAGDVDLGTVTKASIIDPAVADAAFALKENEISAPVTGRFGTVLVQVTKIVPGEQKTFEEVAPQIKRELATSRTREEIGTLRDKIEDERAGGATLEETAKKLSLKYETIEATDRAGRDPEAKAIAALPRTPDVVSAIFSSDVGVDNNALQLQDGGYLYFDVVGVTPARERKLDEVKAEVEARWRDDQIARRLQTKSDEIMAKLKDGTALTQVATDNGLTVQTAADLQRGRAAGFLPAKVVDEVFRTPKDATGSAEGDKPTDRFIFRVTGVTEPTLDPASEQAKALSNLLQNAYADDIVGSYIGRLESDYGITINQTALNQVIGGAPAE